MNKKELEAYVSCIKKANIGDILEVYVKGYFFDTRVSCEPTDRTVNFLVVAKTHRKCCSASYGIGTIIGSKSNISPFWGSTKDSLRSSYKAYDLISNISEYRWFFFPWPKDILVKRIIKNHEV
jgi:hypothetical protein